jgi:hypothetical protein
MVHVRSNGAWRMVDVLRQRLLQFTFLMHCLALSARAAERIPIAVLPPQIQPGDSETATWQELTRYMFERQLGAAKSVRLLPRTSIDFALRDLGLKPDQPLDSEQAREVGERVESRWVIGWGCQKKGADWSLTATAVNLATGKAFKTSAGPSPDWFQIGTTVATNLLHEFGVTPTTEETSRMERPITGSTKALELLGRAWSANRHYKPLTEVEELLRESVASDPHFAESLERLAHILAAQNRLDEAEAVANQGVKAQPDDAVAHYFLGEVYLLENLNFNARDELLEAVRLDPDDPPSLSFLAMTYANQGKWNAMLPPLKHAESLAPYDPEIHADLGWSYAHLGDPQQALAELRIAERYRTTEDATVLHRLAQGYDFLHDVPKALE